MKMINKYQPKYYNNFRCIGGQCKNNCCNNWIINIDKETYDKYMSLDEETIKEFSQKLSPVDNGAKGAVTLHDPEGNCLFLNESGLCTIQIRFGHDYLSCTCKSYPRLTCIVGGAPECFLELSCEAAAKLILFDKGYMGFDEFEFDLDSLESDNIICTATLDVKKYTKALDGINIFWKLRVTSMAILQCRKYRIRFRMLLLCLFLQEAAKLLSTEQDSEVIDVAELYLDKIESNHFNELYAAMPNGAKRETDVMMDILKDMYTNRGVLFKQSVDRALKGFDMQPGIWNFPPTLSENYDRYYDMYFADKEYIFENYLVHRVLSEGFPFNYKGTSSDIMNNYVDLLAKYNIVEYLFTGLCRSCMKFDKKRIIDCISIFTRSYEHSKVRFLTAEDLK